MKENELQQYEGRNGPAIECETNPPHRNLALKNTCYVAVATVMLQLWLPVAANSQPVMLQPPSSVRLVSSGNPAQKDAVQVHFAQPHAVALTVAGQCDYSEDGVNFLPLSSGHILGQGAIVRTGEDGWTDLFFRQIGTTIRLPSGTEIKLEKIAMTLKDSLLVEHTLLDLRRGRMFTIFRSAKAGNSLEVLNAAGRSLVEGSGLGRYIISADGTHVAATDSIIPLKLTGDNGIIMIGAGQQFTRHDGKMFPASNKLWGKDFSQLDDLQASTESPATVRPSPKL